MNPTNRSTLKKHRSISQFPCPSHNTNMKQCHMVFQKHLHHKAPTDQINNLCEQLCIVCLPLLTWFSQEECGKWYEGAGLNFFIHFYSEVLYFEDQIYDSIPSGFSHHEPPIKLNTSSFSCFLSTSRRVILMQTSFTLALPSMCWFGFTL